MYDILGGGGSVDVPVVPPDLQKTAADAAAAASQSSTNSYKKTIRMPLSVGKKYKFYFTYLYKDPDTQQIVESDRSPTVTYTFDIPNLTKPVQNLILTPGFKSYGIKFDIDTTSVQEDMVFFESPTGVFAGEEHIVYVGTSTNVTINTADFTPRWVKVRARDKWLDANHSDAVAGPVTPQTADIDTTYTVANPASTSAVASIDSKDLSGFSVVSTITWPTSTDTKTAGYAIRWSSTDPATTTPLWEYAQVAGKDTLTYTITGLIPNTTYYYQVASYTAYDVINWTSPAVSTFKAQDSDGTAAGALARLKSYIAIGGASQDLFKIGTGISQSINLNTDPLTSPTLTAGTYHGIILNKSTTNVGNNFWLTTGQFRVGNSTEFMYWNGTNLYLTGNINATGGKFTGNLQLAIPTGGTISGSLYAGSSATTGARVKFSDQGIFAYDSTSTSNTTGNTVSITAADGKLDAKKGSIAGWTIDIPTGQTYGSISRNGTIFDSNGNITLGDTTGTLSSIVRLSSTDPTYRLWIGSQSSSNAPFKVDANGKLYATGAVFTNASIDAASLSGYAKLSDLSGYATASSVNSKNSTFAQDTAPTATKVGDIWIDTLNGNVIKTWTGSVWTQRTDTTYATKTSLSTKLEAGGYLIANASNQVTGITSNGITITSSGFKINTDTVAQAGSNMVILNSQGIAAYDSTGTTMFSINSSGNAVFNGNITGSSGTFKGTLRAGAGNAYIDTAGSINGIPTISLGAIGFNDSSTGGWTSHCYPYVSGGNFDLGAIAFPWNDLRASGSVMVGYTASGSDAVGVTGGPKTKLFAGGSIYANTLGTTTTAPASGNAIVQSGGYLRVYVSASSRKYKENIIHKDTTNLYDLFKNVNPVTFNYKADFSDRPDETHLGFIAEEVEEALPGNDLVIYKDGIPDAVAYEKIPVLLVGAFKEMALKIENLQKELDNLKK
jgi:hypothetical protein